MVVAVCGYHASLPWFVSPPTVLEAKELGMLYLVPLIAIILTGAGVFSFDAGIYRNPKRRHW